MIKSSEELQVFDVEINSSRLAGAYRVELWYDAKFSNISGYVTPPGLESTTSTTVFTMLQGH